MRLRSFFLIPLFLLLLLPLALAEETTPPGLGKARQEGMRCLSEKDYEGAIRAFAVILKDDPEDSNALYNCACACSLMGKKEYAVAFLRRAVEAGFLDFDHIRSDKDLDPLREEEGYREILAGRKTFQRMASERLEKRYRDKLGSRYSYIRDKKYNLLIITNVDPGTADSLNHSLRRYADAHWRDFFKHKPRATITVLIPKNWEDYAKEFGGRRGAAGFYNHGTRTLTVNLATGGGTMIHEFTHALHYGDMDGLRQRHPMWIVEGFGSLYEQCRILRDGKAVGLTNWRLTRNLQPALRDRPDAYLPWEKVLDPRSGVFRNKQTISMAYAVTRYIFYYMQQKKVLRRFYSLYRTRYKEDPTGVKFLEEVLGKKVEELEKEWKPWVLSLRYGSSRARPKVRLGVYLEAVDGGISITGLVKGSCAEKAGLKSEDILTAADGAKLATVQDLLKRLMKKRPGDTLRLEVLRGKEKLNVKVTLDKR